MRVKIKYFAFFKDITNIGEEVFELEGDEYPLKNVVEYVSRKYGSKFENIIINPRTNEYREGVVILFNEFKAHRDQKVSDGDVISFLPLLAGG